LRGTIFNWSLTALLIIQALMTSRVWGQNQTLDFKAEALKELAPPQGKTAPPSIRPSAVVQTRVIEAGDPLLYEGLQVGLSVQRYNPKGRIPLIVLGEKRLEDQPSAWMYGVEIKGQLASNWLWSHHQIGWRWVTNYANQKVDLRGPTGVSLGETRLHALQNTLFMAQEWGFTARWSLLLDLGYSRFDVIQSGQNAFSETSGELWMVAGRLGVAYRLGAFWVNLEYERRWPTKPSWVEVDSGNWILGLKYAVR